MHQKLFELIYNAILLSERIVLGPNCALAMAYNMKNGKDMSLPAKREPIHVIHDILTFKEYCLENGCECGECSDDEDEDEDEDEEIDYYKEMKKNNKLYRLYRDEIINYDTKLSDLLNTNINTHIGEYNESYEKKRDIIYCLAKYYLESIKL